MLDAEHMPNARTISQTNEPRWERLRKTLVDLELICAFFVIVVTLWLWSQNGYNATQGKTPALSWINGTGLIIVFLLALWGARGIAKRQTWIVIVLWLGVVFSLVLTLVPNILIGMFVGIAYPVLLRKWRKEEQGKI